MRKWKPCNLALGILICGVLTSFPLYAQPKKTQAQDLVDRTAQKHSEVTELELSGTPAGQEGCVTIAATNAKEIGEKCDNDDAIALKTLEPFVEREPDGFDVTAPLHYMNGKLIGTLGIDFKAQAGQTKADILKRTARILREVDQQIPLKSFPFPTCCGRLAREKCLPLRTKGQANAESTALGSGVRKSQPAVVQLGNRTCNSETQTCSAQPIRAHARVVGTKESFKDPGLKFFRNAATRVGDRNLVAGAGLL